MVAVAHPPPPHLGARSDPAAASRPSSSLDHAHPTAAAHPPPIISAAAQQQGAGPPPAAAPQPHHVGVKVRGLPYRSSPADILAFFSGYQFLSDSLQLGLDSAGRPSGEAWIRFVSPGEAQRAVQDLHGKYMGKRYLELCTCG